MNIKDELENLTKEERELVDKLLKDEVFYEDVQRKVYKWPEVSIEQFIDDENYLGQGDEIWPTVKEDIIRIFNGKYKEVFLIEGIGSGKSTKIALCLAYELFNLGRLINPQRFYNLRSMTKIALFNMSVRAGQAKDVLFDDLMAFILGSPWFRENFLPNLKVKSKLMFPSNIYAIPGNSKETAPIGFTLKAAALDESAWFINQSHVGDSMSQGENIYRTLLKRLKSRFKDYLLFVGTSPRLYDDFTESMENVAINDKSKLFVRRPLWKAKPKGFYSRKFFVYDEIYDRIVCTDVKDLIKDIFGFIPDGFDQLEANEVQYLINLGMNINPDIEYSNVINELNTTKKPNIDISRKDILNSFIVKEAFLEENLADKEIKRQEIILDI